MDTTCASTVPGLYSAGDCCATWLWGAIIQGPPPGLSPAGITGKCAAKGAMDYIAKTEYTPLTEEDFAGAEAHMRCYSERKSGFDPRWVTQLLQNYAMPYYVLHIKERDRLEATLTMVEYLRHHMIPKMRAEDPHMLRLAHETENMALSAEMTLLASLFRTESRGWHFREDYPNRDDENWLAWNQIQMDSQGEMLISKVNVPDEWRPKGKVEIPETWLAWEHPHEDAE